MLNVLRKIFIGSQYLIWIASFILLCCECDNDFIFIVSKLIAGTTFVISSLLITKFD